MKVLVIGRSGQLATSLLDASCPPGITLHSVGRPQLDITQPASVRECLREVHPDVVVNAAAYTAVDKAEEEPEAAFAVNAEGAGLIAEECSRLNVPLVHVSTDYVFDGRKEAPYQYREDDAPCPLNVYGQSKLAGEEAIRQSWHKHVILRTAWVFSAYGQNFVKTMIRLASERDVIRVVGDQHGSPTFAAHLAQGILQLLSLLGQAEKAERVWGTYHMAGTGRATWKDLAVEVMTCLRQAGKPHAAIEKITTEEYPVAAKRPANSSLDCSRLERAVDIRLPRWQLGVAECINQING